MSYYEKKYDNWELQVIEASKTSKSSTEAAAKLGIKFDTYKKYAVKYGCYTPNQSGKGTSKNMKAREIPLDEILDGQHPQYQSNKLRQRLLQETYFESKCYSCGLDTWLSQPIPLELEHIDGNSSNHKLENLTLLCPNCHAFTSTYRGKNSRKV